MNTASIALAVAPLRHLQRWTAALRYGEQIALCAGLAAMVMLPLAEMVLRRTFGVGIAGSAVLVQHLTLVAGMLGAAIAACDDRLLSLSTLPSLLPGRAQAAARFLSSTVAAAVSALLCAASLKFVIAERAAGDVLTHALPVWSVQAVMPVGFALIALHLVQRASPATGGRLAAALVTAATVFAATVAPLPPEQLFIPAALMLAAATLLGAPVFVVLAGLTLLVFWQQGMPVASIALDHYRLVVDPSLPAIPLFTLAGYFLAAGGAPQRLTRVFQAMFGCFRGGMAIATVVVGAFFTAFTGASGVTILALGGMLMPLLASARYSERDSLGLVTTVGSLGVLLPPCLPLILYAIVAKVNMQQMFLGALLPGVLLIAITAWWGVRRNRDAAGTPPPFDARELKQALWAAKWELVLPAIALGSLLSGIATTVEAAALTALYAWFVEAVIYRELKTPARTAATITECGVLVGGVLLILGVALGLTNLMIDAQIPDRIIEWVTHTIHAKWAFLVALNVFLLVVGCLMDIFSAIIVVAPLVVPLGLAFGVDPVHLGVIFLANLELGYLTPPVGVNLFYSSSRFNKPMSEVSLAVAPIILALSVGVAIITYLPGLSTWLPAIARPVH
jgi:C4-dicarboxylate transporter DctM subunit